jgi:hypothetical protein
MRHLLPQFAAELNDRGSNMVALWTAEHPVCNMHHPLP